MSLQKTALGEVLACAHRLLEADAGHAWDEATRDAVARALKDQACLVDALEALIETGKPTWEDADRFRAWLATLTS